VEGVALPLDDAGVDVGVLGGVEVRAAVEGEDEAVRGRRAAVEAHPRLVRQRAVVGEHELAVHEVVHRDHLVRRSREERLLHHGPARGHAVRDGGRGVRLAVPRLSLPGAGERLQPLERGLAVHGLCVGEHGDEGDQSEEHDDAGTDHGSLQRKEYRIRV
jgi:hypothetical protein